MIAAPAFQLSGILSRGEFARLDAAPPASAPGRIRFRKDVLRVGRVVADGRELEITPSVLATIKRNYDDAAARGNRIPVVWGHPEDLIDPRSNLGIVESLDLDGDTLFATFWASEPDAVKLSSGVADQVSVRLDSEWVDGQGNRYAPMLTHLGVVNLPVLSNQGPMVQLSLVQPKRTTKMLSIFGKKQAGQKLQFAADDSGSTDTFTVDEVKQMLSDAGFPIPDIATTKEAVMAAFIAMAGGEESAEEPASTDPANVPVVSDPGAAAPFPMSTLARRAKAQVAEFASLKAQLDAKDRELGAIKAANLSTLETAYRAELEKHIAGGKLVPAKKDEWLAIGKATGFKLSTLSVFDDAAPVVKTDRRAIKLATGTVPGDNSAAIAAKQKQFAERLGVSGIVG